MPSPKRLFITTFCLLAFAAAPSPAQTIIVTWDNQALQAIRDTKPGPPIVPRMLAITHTCAYDAWAAYDAKAVGTRLGGTLPSLRDWNVARCKRQREGGTPFTPVGDAGVTPRIPAARLKPCFLVAISPT